MKSPKRKGKSSFSIIQDMEEIIIGTLLISQDAIHIVGAQLKPEMFSNPEHQAIYKIIFELYQKTIPIDLLTVTEACLKAGILQKIGGPARLTEFTSRVTSSANIEAHCKILMQYWIKRKIVETCSNILSKSTNESIDFSDLLSDLNNGLIEITDEIHKGKSESLSDLGIKLLKEVECAKDKSLVPLFDLPKLDELIGGSEEGDLIVVGGRPGMGKSSLLNNALLNAVKNNISTYFCSMEMSPTQTLLRLVSARANIDSKRIKSNELTGEEFDLVVTEVEKLSEAPIVVDNTSGMNVLDLRAKIITYQKTHGIRVAILDRIGLLQYMNPNGNDVQELTRITTTLRRTAGEIGITIIIISQLSRQVELRGGAKIPRLADLRSSGSLEQDATKVLLVYRPEYYNINEDEYGNSLKGLAFFHVEKNTNGTTGEVMCRFDAKTTQFKDLNHDTF